MTNLIDRYKVVEGSQTGHCCFEFTTVDTTKPFMINRGQFEGEFEQVCEVLERGTAGLIVNALNANSASVEKKQIP